jgi:hypothetical protein
MFNRTAEQESSTVHNIQDTMGQSFKKTCAGTWLARSQKRGKTKSHRRFRRRERTMIQNARYDRLPLLQRELTNQYDLGGDGKAYWHVDGELRVMLTRK